MSCWPDWEYTDADYQIWWNDWLVAWFEIGTLHYQLS